MLSSTAGPDSKPTGDAELFAIPNLAFHELETQKRRGTVRTCFHAGEMVLVAQAHLQH